LEAPPLEHASQTPRDVVDVDRLREDVDVAGGSQPLDVRGIGVVGQSDRERAVP
jgi:hypothetical protein